jgi:hypothetical protein
MPRSPALALIAIGLVTSCRPAFRDCAPPPPAILAQVPDRLSATGLYRDVRGEALADGVQPFAPRFALWTDGAAKRRWIYLPPRAQIDTRDPDAWNFPVGTKLWKELSYAGVRVETRMLYKHGPQRDAWTPIAYVWADDGDAHARPDGVIDARHTGHAVPSAAACLGCHGGTPSGVLGFSAIQLPRHAKDGALDLARLEAAHAVSRPLPANDLPGDPATQAALGYLHANCSHCHNQFRPAHTGPRCFDPERAFSFLLRTGELASPGATATFRTAIGPVIEAGDPDASAILDRMQSRNLRFGMPALGTDTVDRAGVQLIRTWIAALGARP